jgi:hypothetical protein
MSASPSITLSRRPVRPRVVCGVDPDEGSEDAVDRACGIAGPRGHVALVCVLDASGRDGALAPARAASVLERAMRQTRAAGVRSSVYLLRSRDPVGALLRAAVDGTALVLDARSAVAAPIAAAAGLLDCPVTVVERASA